MIKFLNLKILLIPLKYSELEQIPQFYGKGGGCLIATATYDTELSPQVQQLRELEIINYYKNRI